MSEIITAVCGYCGEGLALADDVWLDNTDGDACFGDDTFVNENEPHVPEFLVAPKQAKEVYHDIVKRKSTAQINELAAELVRGETFLAWAWDKNAVQYAFGFILMTMGEQLPRTEIVKIGALYAPMKSTIGDRGINGYPMMSTCAFLHINDVDRLWARIQEIETFMYPNGRPEEALV